MKRSAFYVGKEGMHPFEAGLLHYQRCSNRQCNRPFKVIRFIGQPSGLTNIGKLVCPHCGTQNIGQCHSIYLALAMTASEEAKFGSWMPDEAVKR